MDYLKVYGGSFKEVEKLCDVVHKFSKDIRLKFDVDKCGSSINFQVFGQVPNCTEAYLSFFASFLSKRQCNHIEIH